MLFDTISNILSRPITLVFFASDFNFLSYRLQFRLPPPTAVWDIPFHLPNISKASESAKLHPNLQINAVAASPLKLV